MGFGYPKNGVGIWLNGSFASALTPSATSIPRSPMPLQDPIGFVQKRHDVAFEPPQKETPLTSEVRGETTFSKENHEAATVYRDFTLAALLEQRKGLLYARHNVQVIAGPAVMELLLRGR